MRGPPPGREPGRTRSLARPPPLLCTSPAPVKVPAVPTDSRCEGCRAVDAGPVRASLRHVWARITKAAGTGRIPVQRRCPTPSGPGSGGDRRSRPVSPARASPPSLPPRAAGLASRVYSPGRGCADALLPPSTSPLAAFRPLNETRPTRQSKLAGGSAGTGALGGGGRGRGRAGPWRAVPAAQHPAAVTPRRCPGQA